MESTSAVTPSRSPTIAVPRRIHPGTMSGGGLSTGVPRPALIVAAVSIRRVATVTICHHGVGPADRDPAQHLRAFSYSAVMTRESSSLENLTVRDRLDRIVASSFRSSADGMRLCDGARSVPPCLPHLERDAVGGACLYRSAHCVRRMFRHLSVADGRVDARVFTSAQSAGRICASILTAPQLLEAYMAAARGDRKPCTHPQCTGIMQFGRLSGPSGAVNGEGQRGWVCSAERAHFQLESSRNELARGSAPDTMG